MYDINRKHLRDRQEPVGKRESGKKGGLRNTIFLYQCFQTKSLYVIVHRNVNLYASKNEFLKAHMFLKFLSMGRNTVANIKISASILF